MTYFLDDDVVMLLFLLYFFIIFFYYSLFIFTLFSSFPFLDVFLMTFSIRKQSKHSLAFLDIFAFFVIRFLFEFASKKRSHWVVYGRQTGSDDYHSVFEFLMMYYIIPFFFMPCMFLCCIGSGIIPLERMNGVHTEARYRWDLYTMGICINIIVTDMIMIEC